MTFRRPRIVKFYALEKGITTFDDAAALDTDFRP